MEPKVEGKFVTSLKVKNFQNPICKKMEKIHGSSMSVFSVFQQLSQGRMADFPAFIASKSFDLYLKLNDMSCGTL